MSATIAGLRRKIDAAKDLQSVVRTMKALASSNIGQYEKSVRALVDYFHTVEIGLGACFRANNPPTVSAGQDRESPGAMIAAVVFGSDQGLVGRFNDVVTDFAVETLTALSGKSRIWAVGERVHARLIDAGLPLAGLFVVPNSIKAITPLIAQILMESEMAHRSSGLAHATQSVVAELHLFYNRPTSGAAYMPVSQRLLPLDEPWRRSMIEHTWPSKNLPEVMETGSATLRAYIREYLFVSLFRACAESLASENASRLAAMQRADKNIAEMQSELTGAFHRLRQDSIDEELFDVVSGFEALMVKT